MKNNILELFLKTDLGLDELAERIRTALKVQEMQRRYGLNVGGGTYYQFEVFGLIMELIVNAGEVEFVERAEFPYYIYLHSECVELVDDRLRAVAEHCAAILRDAGVETEIGIV